MMLPPRHQHPSGAPKPPTNPNDPVFGARVQRQVKGSTNDSVMSLIGGGGIEAPASNRRSNSRGGIGPDGFQMGKLDSRMGTN